MDTARRVDIVDSVKSLAGGVAETVAWGSASSARVEVYRLLVTSVVDKFRENSCSSAPSSLVVVGDSCSYSPKDPSGDNGPAGASYLELPSSWSVHSSSASAGNAGSSAAHVAIDTGPAPQDVSDSRHRLSTGSPSRRVSADTSKRFTLSKA